MQSYDAIEPTERDLPALKRALKEWEAVASQLISSLNESAECTLSENWRPHRDQMVNAVTLFRDICTRESHRLGIWREDSQQPGEVYDSVWEHGDRLSQWLDRMTKQPGPMKAGKFSRFYAKRSDPLSGVTNHSGLIGHESEGQRV